MFFGSYLRRLRLWETDYGREAGWVVEHQSKAIALLTDPRSEDMFWHSYRMEVVTNDSELREVLWTKAFWDEAEMHGLVWRNREFGEVAPLAFPGLSPLCKPGRLMMRGLYLKTGKLWPWDWVVLWIRRWLGRRCRVDFSDKRIERTAT